MPCIYHTHGGGMTILHTRDKMYRYQCDAMAASGLVVVSVEFRNCGAEDGPNTFPAGLVSALQPLRGARRAHACAANDLLMELHNLAHNVIEIGH